MPSLRRCCNQPVEISEGRNSLTQSREGKTERAGVKGERERLKARVAREEKEIRVQVYVLLRNLKKILKKNSRSGSHLK